MYQPQAIYKIEKTNGSKSSSLIWSEVFEGRYAAEVQHAGAHKGNLIIFDSQRNFRVMHEDLVDVDYDGKSVDPADVSIWTTIAIGVIQDSK